MILEKVRLRNEKGEGSNNEETRREKGEKMRMRRIVNEMESR